MTSDQVGIDPTGTEQYRAEQYRAEPSSTEQYRAEQYRTEQDGGDQYRAEQAPAGSHRSEPAHVADDRRLTPADVERVTFHHATMLHPGYVTTEVDDFLSVISAELGRLAEENQQLHSHVHTLEQRAGGAPAAASPVDQAVGILATAQQTADQYVAEAEEFSRQLTSEARAQYEEQLAQAREKAGAIIQAAQEAATRVVGAPPQEAPAGTPPDVEQLQEQVVYLRAFGQAVRTQLRSYLEALLTDVEAEWGRADPAALPPVPNRVLSQRPEAPAPR